MNYADLPIITQQGWRLLYGGSRKGAYLSIERVNDGALIDASVKEWLDTDMQPTQRKNASYMVARRWSYGAGTRHIGQWFLVEVRPA